MISDILICQNPGNSLLKKPRFEYADGMKIRLNEELRLMTCPPLRDNYDEETSEENQTWVRNFLLPSLPMHLQ